ncbi:MAG: DUF4153 domain-containing protein [bacterium]|nr:DUF4153 domain-containing protein [bacterium]
MRFSLSQSMVDIQQSLIRFPFVLLCAVLASFAAIQLEKSHNQEAILLPLLLAGVLGIPVMIFLTLVTENSEFSKGSKLATRFSGLVLLANYGFFLPMPLHDSLIIQFFILFLGAHFIISVAPFLGGGDGNSIWHFNKTLLLRFLSSAIFTVVLFAGLSLALLALDKLLGLKLPSDIYYHLMVLLGFVFNTWFTLGGIPKNPREKIAVLEYPRALQVFAQYILSTLVLVYLSIFMIYLVKIVVSGIWPSGWIGWLVSGVASVGLLSLVLLWPLTRGPGHKWVDRYFLLFQIFMIPSATMLILAVSKRVNQYGLTELRYVLLVLACWLVVAVVMSIYTRRLSLKAIPLSLGILALLISFGPWGATDLSMRSQKGRLEKTLFEAGFLVDGKLFAAFSPDVDVDQNEIRNSFRYQIQQFGLAGLRDWFSPELTESIENSGTFQYRGSRVNLIMADLGFHDGIEKPLRPVLNHVLQGEGHQHAIDLDGFQYSLLFELTRGQSSRFDWGGENSSIDLDDPGGHLEIRRQDEMLINIPLVDLLKDLVEATDDGRGFDLASLAEMTFDFSNEKARIRLILHRALFRDDQEQPLVVNIQGVLLLAEVTGN